MSCCVSDKHLSPMHAVYAKQSTPRHRVITLICRLEPIRLYTIDPLHFRPPGAVHNNVRCHKEIDDFCKVLFASHFVVQLRQQSSRCKLYTILLLLVSFCVCVYWLLLVIFICIMCVYFCVLLLFIKWRRNRGFRRFNEPGLPSSWGPE